MPLKPWPQLLAALLTLFTRLRMGRRAATERQPWQRAAAGRAAVDPRHQALTAAEPVARERGPRNGLPGGDGSALAQRRSALDDARGRTDTAFTAFTAFTALKQMLARQAGSARRRDASQPFAAADRARAQAGAELERTTDLPLAEHPPDRLRNTGLGLLIELQIRLALPEPAMQASWQRVHAQHFQQAQGLIEQVIAAGNADGRYGMDPAGFAARWCWCWCW